MKKLRERLPVALAVLLLLLKLNLPLQVLDLPLWLCFSVLESVLDLKLFFLSFCSTGKWMKIFFVCDCCHPSLAQLFSFLYCSSPWNALRPRSPTNLPLRILTLDLGFKIPCFVCATRVWETGNRTWNFRFWNFSVSSSGFWTLRIWDPIYGGGWRGRSGDRVKETGQNNFGFWEFPGI